MDLAEFQGQNYLVVTDYDSKWLEVVKLKRKTCEEVIKKVKKIFGRLGIPKIIITDNNPFDNYDLKKIFNGMGKLKISLHNFSN